MGSAHLHKEPDLRQRWTLEYSSIKCNKQQPA